MSETKLVVVSLCPVEVQESTAEVPLSSELLQPTPPHRDCNLVPTKRWAVDLEEKAKKETV